MLNLLIIDDNPFEHLIMQKMLDKFQLFPEASHSLDAKTMIEFFEQYHLATNELPDIIFLDLNMPGFSGWDFLNRFSQLYKRFRKSIDVYIVSSSIDPNDKLLADKYPFIKGSLCKPVQMETLLNLHSLYSNRLAC
jgi:CheY-like chemotaxis protein